MIFKSKKKYNIYGNFVVITLLVIATFFSCLNYINSKITNNLAKIFDANVNKLNNYVLVEYVNKEILSGINLNNIIDLVKNNDNEIIAVDYNLENAYALLSIATKSIKEGIESLNTENLANMDAMFNSGFVVNDGIVIAFPLGVISDRILFTNLGPNIPIKLRMIDDLANGIYTKVSNYGINNVLVEIYMQFNMKTTLITPVGRESLNNNYNILIGSMIVNGEVPNYLGMIESNSPIIEQ